jgi:hypothetical protein
MAAARSAHDWAIAASVMALLANCHRDPKKGRAAKPADFDPFAERRAAEARAAGPPRLDGTITVREMFPIVGKAARRAGPPQPRA